MNLVIQGISSTTNKDVLEKLKFDLISVIAKTANCDTAKVQVFFSTQMLDQKFDDFAKSLHAALFLDIALWTSRSGKKPYDPQGFTMAINQQIANVLWKAFGGMYKVTADAVDINEHMSTTLDADPRHDEWRHG